MTLQERLLLGYVVIAVLLAAGPVMAAPGDWTTLSPISGSCGLVSDGTTLYKVDNTGPGGVGQVYSYSGPTTDTWTLVNTAPFSVFAQWSPGEGDWAKCIDGKIYTRQSDNMNINIYDIATQTWTQTSTPLLDPVNDYYAWSQQQAAGNGQITVQWTEISTQTGGLPLDPNTGNPTSGWYAANYNIAAKTWSAPYDIGAQPTMWMQTNQLNGVVYAVAGLGSTLTVKTYDLKTQPANFSGTWGVISYTLPSGTMSSDPGGAFGTQIIGVDKAKGKVYFSGVNNPATSADILGGQYDGGAAAPVLGPPPNPSWFLRQNWVYDPNSPLVGTQPYGHGSDGWVYIWEYAAPSPTKLVSYDPATNTWTELPDGIGQGTYRSEYASDRAGNYIYLRENNLFQAFELAPVLLGDTNGNGVVNVIDLNNVLNNIGTSAPIGDTNGDNIVDVLDLNNVLNNIGTVAAAGSAVPEPATLTLLALGGLALLRRRRAA